MMCITPCYMQIIATYVRQLSSQGKKVRVLEVGAGVGCVTRQLLPKLKDTPNIEYWFTDLGIGATSLNLLRFSNCTFPSHTFLGQHSCAPVVSAVEMRSNALGNPTKAMCLCILPLVAATLT